MRLRGEGPWAGFNGPHCQDRSLPWSPETTPGNCPFSDEKTETREGAGLALALMGEMGHEEAIKDHQLPPASLETSLFIPRVNSALGHKRGSPAQQVQAQTWALLFVSALLAGRLWALLIQSATEP